MVFSLTLAFLTVSLFQSFCPQQVRLSLGALWDTKSSIPSFLAQGR
jgi:hypothetical protein